MGQSVRVRPPHISDRYAISDATYTNHGCRCVGCNDAHNARHKKWRDHASPEARQNMVRRINKHKDRINEELRADAVNHGKPWTPEDKAVLADDSLTNRQAAVLLGRTLYTVKQTRYQMRKAQRQSPEVADG